MASNSIDSLPSEAFIERIERLEEEKRALAEDIRMSMPRPRAPATTSR